LLSQPIKIGRNKGWGDVVVMNYGFSTSLGEREIGGMGAHSKERKRRGEHYNCTSLFCYRPSCHLVINLVERQHRRGKIAKREGCHLVINLVERQHRKGKIAKREGDKANESERRNDRKKERGGENKKRREKDVKKEKNVDGNYNY
jgi:hypothetical protein